MDQNIRGVSCSEPSVTTPTGAAPEPRANCRRDASRKAAQTRRTKRQLNATILGQLALTLYEAQQASDRAKARAASGLHFDDYDDRSRYSAANYRRSRRAIDSDYWQKGLAIDKACELAPQAGVVFGWREDRTCKVAPWVVYFELPSGQVSFHSSQRGAGPDYAGAWDGTCATRTRIRALIDQLTQRETVPAMSTTDAGSNTTGHDREPAERAEHEQ
jgi:hypothetical protein